MKAFSTKLTIETMIEPNSAGQNPLTLQPKSKSPDTHEVSQSIRALITIRNRPRVNTTTIAVTTVKIGFTIAFTTPKIKATISSVNTLPWVVGAVRAIPLSSQVAT